MLKKSILEEFLFSFFPKMKIFLINSVSSVFDPYDPLTSCNISEKSYEQFLRKAVY